MKKVIQDGEGRWLIENVDGKLIFDMELSLIGTYRVLDYRSTTTVNEYEFKTYAEAYLFVTQ